MATRMAVETDLQACLEVHSSWANWLRQSIPEEQCWCPAGCQIPQQDDEAKLRMHLCRQQSALWGIVSEEKGQLQGYLLCQSDAGHEGLTIVSPKPRVLTGTGYIRIGSLLIAAALQEGARQGLRHARVSLHGPAVEVSSLVKLYKNQGFTIAHSEPRLEMIRHRSVPLPETLPVILRSASDVGLSAFFAADASIRGCSLHESQQNLELSQRMWIIDPSRDWIMACNGSEVIGIAETAVTRSGVGVIDHIEVRSDYRGRGVGRSLLANAVKHLASMSEHIWLDVDRDNMPAIHLYQQLGFRLYHEHGSMRAAM